ncbi:MAG: hypothetical protein HFJ24_06750 [Clostridia bacterium]|nr:hypothetical protein [Clostridia bacterium]MCI9275629.1 hypothetical protein [Clostridia bacterium]
MGEEPPEEGWTVEEAKGLVERDGLKAHLGEKVDYNPIGGGTWRIFYYDDEDQGNGKGYFGDDVGTVYLKRDYDSELKTQLDNYTSYNPTDNGAMMKQMNPKWRDSSYSNIDNINEHCVAWLCDATQWTLYKVDGVAKYAIGTPSVEMYMKSFNIYKEDDTALINGIQSSNGYVVGANGGYMNNGYYTKDNAIEAGPNNIYMTAGYNYYWWLASPSHGHAASLLYVRGENALLYYDGYSRMFGTCPIVALIK